MLASTISNEWVYVGVSWVATVGVIGGYAAVVIRRGKQLSKRVPADRRRWM